MMQLSDMAMSAKQPRISSEATVIRLFRTKRKNRRKTPAEDRTVTLQVFFVDLAIHLISEEPGCLVKSTKKIDYGQFRKNVRNLSLKIQKNVQFDMQKPRKNVQIHRYTPQIIRV